MLKNILILIIIAYAALVLFAYFYADKMIFLPPHPGYKDSEHIIKLVTKNHATISAIYLPNIKAKYTVLVSHGNAEDIGYMMPFLIMLHQHDFAVFAYDYQGYGTSNGKPTEKHSYNDIDAAYSYLTKKLKTAPENIIGYGISVGAAVTIDLATRKKLAAIILQSPFVSAFRVLTHIPILPFDKFNNIDKIKNINCPVLIIHGTKDRIVPIWHSKKLYLRAKQPKYHYWVKGAGHNDLIVVAKDKLWHKIANFL